MRDHLCRSLFADTFYTFDIVGRVALEALKIRHGFGFDEKLFLDELRIVFETTIGYRALLLDPVFLV